MKTIAYLLLILSLCAAVFPQGKTGRRYNAYSGNFVLSVEGGTAIGATDYVGTHPDYMGKATLEYFFPTYSASSFGLRIFGNAGYISEKEEGRTPPLFRTTIATAGGGVVYMLNAGDFFFPYLFAGAGYLYFDPRDEFRNRLPGNRNNLYQHQELNYMGEFGMRFMLTENLSLNLSTGIQISPDDVWDDSREGGTNDMLFTAMAGLSFSFFFDKDSDNDGIENSRDLCPNTPPGILVDATGCPHDSDKDGVPDYQDKCPNTPSKIRVNESGCPLDSDNDGVPDYQDICPRTPEGTIVDKSGCPVDADNDGVSDDKDQCPETPSGVEVTPEGCPKDDDMDGVPDYKDKCPRTPAGEKVDADGCSIKGDVVRKESETKEIILNAGASFEFGRTEIIPAAYEQLNQLVLAMKENPMSRWRIEGYTDNVGSDNSNKKISLKRAQAVLEYFVSKGISRSRFEIFGYGKDNPVANNNTEEGRAKNRRVRILRIN